MSENNFIQKLKNFSDKIFISFEAATKGQEDFQVVIWLWGIFSFFICYFLIRPILVLSKIKFFDTILCLVVIAYYVWHIVAVKRCSPKTPKLSEEEKKKLKEDRYKRWMRKLLLQEPMAKWNPALMMIAADLYVIATFLEYILR